ncbi:helix-turn-helix domain-containing protein [Fusobacterium sp.]|uniref:helix-turn-helix domain-containing protein n=1 Tax=Fusobacterium sp. TaxID=68766 RepID=UPI00396C7311
MTNISLKIGENIRKVRKSKNISLEKLADKIDKSKSTVAKYECGLLKISVEVLYEIADAMKVSVNTLLVPQGRCYNDNFLKFKLPHFYEKKKLYGYWWDARNDILNQCALIINDQDEEQANKFNIVFYMNLKDFNKPYLCENTYIGTIELHNVITSIDLHHRDTPLEHVVINILEVFNDKTTKWGLYSGVSFRPFEPVSLKILFSKEQLTFNKDNIKLLLIDRDDIQRIKRNNYFSVVNSKKFD